MSRRRVVFAVAVVIALAAAVGLASRGARDGGGPGPRSGGRDPVARGGLAGSQAPHPGLGWVGQRGAPARRVAGRVIFEGRPVPGALVRLTGAADRDSRPAAVTTGDDGRFDFGPRDAAEVVIGATADGKAGAVLALDLRDPALRPRPDDLLIELYPCDASIHGFVQDAGGGPIPGAVLRRGPLEVVAADDGAYAVCLPIGTSLVEVGAAGYGTLAVSLAVTNRVRRDFRLSPEGVITGHAVRADDGTPVADAVVVVASETSPAGDVMIGHGAGARAVTDADGQFRIDGLVPGRRTLYAAAAGLRARPTDVNVIAGDGDDPLTVELEPATTVRGRVVDEAGVAVAGASVRLLDRERADYREPDGLRAISQADGTFVLDGVRPGAYRVTTAPYLPTERVRLDVPAAGVADLTLVVRRGSTIAGVVTHAGKPAGGALVYVRAGGFARVHAAADGRFVLAGIAPGEHELYAESEQLGAFTRGPTVTVTAGTDLAGVTLDLGLAGSIAGVVVDQHGAPVSGAYLAFELEEGNDVGASTTAEDGTFEARALSGGGSYGVEIMASRWSSLRFLPAKGNDFAPVFVADGRAQVTGVRFEAAVDRLAIGGRVVDEHGAPRPDVRVEVTPTGRWDGDEMPYDVTGVDGTFTIDQLLAGTYHVVALAGNGAEARAERPVAAGTRDVSLVLATPGEIAGTLAGFPSPPRVVARLIGGRPGAADPTMSATTAGASFRVRGVTPGAYMVTALWRGVVGDSQVVTVRAGETAKVTLTHRGTGSIDVSVVYPDGRPVAGASCAFWDAAFMGDLVPTDDAGRVTLAPVSVGDGFISCDLRDRGVSGRVEVTVVADATVTATIMMAPRQAPKAHGTIGAVFESSGGQLRVASLVTGGPAATAGMQVRDVVLGLVLRGDDGDDLPFRELDGATMGRIVGMLAPGMKLGFRLRRGSTTIDVDVTVAEP